MATTATTVRARIDGELSRQIGKWFTLRQMQDKLKINQATLKRLILRYASESVLRRRKVKGTARAVEFSPAAANLNGFQKLLINKMPARTKTTSTKTKTAKSATKTATKKSSATRSTKTKTRR